jgi:uncharacterized NAD(P)/FAD-binding protein YdhS
LRKSGAKEPNVGIQLTSLNSKSTLMSVENRQTAKNFLRWLSVSFRNQKMLKPRVGILGGGLSGLCAAHFLKKRFGNHIEIEILEKGKEVSASMCDY